MNTWERAKEEVLRSTVLLNLIRTASLLHLGANRHWFVLPLPGSSQCPSVWHWALGPKRLLHCAAGARDSQIRLATCSRYASLVLYCRTRSIGS